MIVKKYVVVWQWVLKMIILVDYKVINQDVNQVYIHDYKEVNILMLHTLFYYLMVNSINVFIFIRNESSNMFYE